MRDSRTRAGLLCRGCWSSSASLTKQMSSLPANFASFANWFTATSREGGNVNKPASTSRVPMRLRVPRQSLLGEGGGRERKIRGGLLAQRGVPRLHVSRIRSFLGRIPVDGSRLAVRAARQSYRPSPVNNDRNPPAPPATLREHPKPCLRPRVGV